MSSSRASTLSRFFVSVALLAGAASAQSFPPPTPSTGFVMNLYATLPSNPTALAIDAQNNLFALDIDGRIHVIRDLDGDGIGETASLFYDGTLTFVYPCTGLAIHQGEYFVANRGVVSKLLDADQNLVADSKVDIVTGLPNNMHQNNGFAFDGAGNMYFGVGSLTDHGVQTAAQAATIMQCDLNGQNLQIYATGIRNAYGLAYKPGFGLLCTENSWNAVFTDPSYDEINLVQQGADYGFPWHTGPAPAIGPGAGTTDPIALIPAHSAPCGLTFDELGQFSGFPNDVFVSFVAGGAGAVARVGLFQHPTSGVWYSTIDSVALGFAGAIDCKFSQQGELFVADFQSFQIHRIRQTESTKIRIQGMPRLGTPMTVTCSALLNPAEYLIVALSTEIAPGAALPDGRVFPLNIATPVFEYSTTPGNVLNLFAIPDYTDAAGNATGTFYLPNVPWAAGMWVHTAFVTVPVSLASFGAVSGPLSFQLIPN
jgi:glucose/arabinose dehydrogenase